MRKSGFTSVLADAVETAMDIHDADRFVSQLAGFVSSAMAIASPGDLVSASASAGKKAVGGRPSRKRKAAYYLTMKFSYNLSEKKIIRMLREIGCKVKQPTLNKWMHRVMQRVREAMQPVLVKEVQSSKFMHNDETRILVRVWNEEKQKEEYRICYIHGAYAPDSRLLAMIYENGSREAAVIEEALFRGFKGEGFTADRCPIYDVVATDSSGKIILEYGACWTHARRYCLQAYLSDSRFEGVMKCINVLFSIERHCRVMDMTPRERLSFREKHR